MAGQLIDRGPGKWLVRVYLGREQDGKRKYYSKTVHCSKKEAQKFLTEKLHEHDRGRMVQPSRKTMREFLLDWIDRGKPGIQQRTRDSYRWVITRYILPALGTRRLDQLGPFEIQELYTALSERGLAPRTVRYTHSILRSALGQAMRWRMIGGNPADHVELPAKASKEMRALSPKEASQFLKVIRGDRWEMLWELLLVTGLRPGEALGLNWSDVDWAGRRLSIQRTLARGDDHKWRLVEPKTDRSRRRVVVPPSSMDSLKRHRARQAEERLARGSEYDGDLNLIFANRRGEPLDHRSVVRRHFKPLVEAAGLDPLRPYDLRHTCATLLLAGGEHPKVVAERLGHLSTVMTMDVYSHVLPDMQEETAHKLEVMLFGSQGKYGA